MDSYHVRGDQGPLRGCVKVPPSKSHTLRAILFAALARGTSTLRNYLPSPDTFAMIEAVKFLGAKVHILPHLLQITGTQGRFSPAENVIDCGNSGQVLRFVGALSALLPSYTVLTGDASIRHNRPVQPLLEALRQLGAFAESSRGDGFAPVIIQGPLTRSHATLDGQDSQPVSGLIIAAAFAPHPIEIHVTNPGELPWIDLTLDWLKRLNIPYQRQGHHFYRLEGGAKIDAFDYFVPGDFSSAAFPIAAALATGSELTLQGMDMEDCQGDKKLIPLLEEMGASFEIDPEAKTLKILRGAALQGKEFDINDCIDALPILSVLGCFAQSPLRLRNAAIARKKESDRISCIVQELKKMGAQIEEFPDGLIVHPSLLKGAELNSHHDHRLAMSLTIAALKASSPSLIQDVACIAKTYPDFYEQLIEIGANLHP